MNANPEKECAVSERQSAFAFIRVHPRLKPIPKNALRGPDAAPFTCANSMVNLRRVIVGFYFVLFLGVGLTSGVIFLQARAEYDQLKQQEAASRRRLAESEARLREQEKIIDRLRHDPVYLEKVIRRRLNYAKPDEFIFRFED